MSSHGLRRSVRVLLFVLTVCLVSSLALSQTKTVSAGPSAKDANALRTFKNIERPLTFEENQGQFDSKARFVSRGTGYELLLSPSQADISLSKSAPSFDARGRRTMRIEHADTLHLTLEGANPKATISGEDKLATKSNYYISNDRSKWRQGVPNFSRVRYESIYPGIDLVYYGNQRRLEHDFVVAPGGDPKQIRIGVSGAKSVYLDSNGDVVMEAAEGSLRLLNPALYQNINGQRRPVSGHYQLAADKSVRFSVGRYDKRRALVIDPVLSYSTYLGGSATDYGFGVAVSGSNVYVAGFTNSTDFVGTDGGFQCCSFVTAINLNSSFPVYTTYVSANIIGFAGNPIAVDPNGSAYVTGSTAGGLPIVGSGFPSATYGGGQFDAFVMKLSSSGNIVASGYLGGSGYDIGNGIAYDPKTSHVLLTGTSQSANFPTINSQIPLDAAQLYTSQNAGSTWTTAFGTGLNTLGGMDVQATLIVPGTLAPTKYYVGGTAGVYTSSNAGGAWAPLNFGLQGLAVESLAYDSFNGNIYAGTSSGVYLNTPGSGGEWMLLTGGPQDGVSELIVLPSTANSAATIYAVDAQKGFYVSTDGGTSWSNNNTGLPNSTGYVYGLSIARGSNGKLYAAVQSYSTSVPQFYVSTDATNWVATTGTGFPVNYSSYNHNSLFIDSTDRLYLGDNYSGSAYTSTDGGNTWTALGTPSGSAFSIQFNFIVVDPLTAGTIYAGTNDGLFKSTNFGSNWARVDNSFTSTSVNTIAVDTVATTQLGKTVLFAGAMTGQGFVASLSSSDLSQLSDTVFGGDNVAPYFAPSVQGNSVASDSSGNIYATGSSYSSALTFPSRGSSTPAGDGDAFLLALDSNGNSLWTRFIGGTYYDNGQSIAVGADNGIVVYGGTNSPDLPTTTGAYQTTCDQPGCPGGLFISKYSTSGTNVFTTYFDPLNTYLYPFAMALDSASNIYFLSSSSTQVGSNAGGVGSLPLLNPLDQPLGGLGDSNSPYIAELNSSGTTLLFSTTLNGNTPGDGVGGTGIALDAANAIYVTGYTSATDFPIAGSSPVDTVFNHNVPNTQGTHYTDAFLVQISRTGISNDVALQVYPTTVNAHVGDTVTFNFTISNLTTTGTGANNVVLETDLPLTGVSIPGVDCSIGTPSRCYIGLLLPGTSLSGSATTAYATVSPVGSSFSNVLVVRTDDDDPNPGNNSAVVKATIQAALPPDLQVTVSPATQSSDSGGTAKFTVNVTNNGLGIATNINLHSTLSVYSGGPFFSNVGSQWVQLLPPGAAPSARQSMKAVYDPNSNSLIVFGGFETGRGDDNDVWVLSHANGNGLSTWTQLFPTGTPPVDRFGHTAVYDSTSNRLIIFGGSSDFTKHAYNDVWVLTNANGQGGTPQWIKLGPSGTPPVASDSAEAIYDPATHTMTVFGGYSGGPGCGTESEVWILTNADGTTGTPNWTQLNPTGTPASGQAYGTAVYDPVTNRMIVFGGYGPGSAGCSDSADVTILTNANGQGGSPQWISPSLGSESVPSARQGHVAAYDPTNNTMIMFGGGGLDETWQLSNANGVSGNPTWTLLQPVGDAGPRTSGAGAYDPSTHALIQFGGYDPDMGSETNMVWTLKGFTSNCSFNSAIADATCQLGNLAPGQSTTLGLQASINTANVGDSITFTAAATEDQDDANVNDNTGTATITIANPDLGISLIGPTSPIFHGNAFPDTFAYKLTVTNNGDINSGSPTVLVQLDPNLTYQGEGCSQNGSNLICAMGPLTPGTNEYTTITVSANALGTYTSSAAFYQDGNGNPYSDANPMDDSSGPVQTTVAGSADLELSLSTDYYGTVGAPLAINADVYNGGPSDAGNVKVTLTLPPQLSLGFGTPNCSGSTGTITCTLGKILYDYDTSVNIPIVANYPGVYTVLATTQDASGTQSPYPNDGISTITFTAIPQLTATSESFVVSQTDQGQVAAYHFGSQGGVISRSGAAPGSSVIDPSGRYMYVNAGGFAAYTSVVDFTVQDEVSRIHGVHGRPMALTPDGTRLIANLASTKTDALAVVDTATQQIIKTISLDGMFGDATGVADLTYSSGVIANNKLYFQVSVLGGSAYSTAVLDLTSYTVKAVAGLDVNAPFATYVRTIAAKSDGTRVYALRSLPPEYLVIDTNTDTVTTTVSLSQFQTPTAIVATRDLNDPQGQFAYIAGDTGDGFRIIPIDLASNSQYDASTSPSFLPTDMVLSSDGTALEVFHLGAANGRANAAYYPAPGLNYDGNSEFTIGGYIGGASVAFLYTNNRDARINGSPSLAYITDVQPNPIDNSTANTVSILGANFTPDAQVRIGHLDRMPATFVSSGRLDVTLPPLVPEQDANVVVTLPNLQEILTGRNVSTIWSVGSNFVPNPLRLGITSTFTLPNALGILRHGDSTVDLVSTNKNGNNLGTIPLPTSLVFAPDGQTVYVSAGAQLTGVEALDRNTGQPTAIPVPNDYVGYQDALATGIDPTDGKAVLYFNRGDANLANNQLSVVDADSKSQTFNSVKRTINAGDNTYSQGSGALAVSPSGRYVYTFADVYQQNSFSRTDLIAYDVKNSSAAIVQDVYNTFGAEQKVPNHLRVSPDGNWLIMPGADGSVKAVSIGSDPSLIQPPSIINVISFSDGTHSFKTFQVVGNRLFAFDANTNTLTAFNFVTGTPNFSKLGSVTLSGPGSLYEAPLLVDPTGSYAYVALKDQDAIAILDANKVAASDPTALLDEGGDNRGVEVIAIQPSVTPQVNVSASLTSASPFIGGQQIFLTGAVGNSSTFDAHSVVVTITPPNGVSFSSVTSDYNNSTCSLTATVATCNIPTLTGGDSASFVIDVTPTSQTSMTFSIAVTSTQETNVSQTPSASTTVTVNPGADLALSSDFANFGTSQLVAGQSTNYSFTISNLGPADNTGGVLTVTSPGLTITSFSTFGAIGCSQGNKTLQCFFESLPANSSYLVSITGTVPNAPTTEVKAQLVGNNDPTNPSPSIDSTYPVYSNGSTTDTFLVPDGYLGTLMGLAPSNLATVGTATAGINPVGALVLPGGRTAFVGSQNAGYISVLDLGSNQEIYRIQDEVVRAAALTTDSSQALVVRRTDPTKLDVFDTTTFALVKTITLTGMTSPPENMFVASGQAFILTKNAGPIYVVNLSTGATSALANTQTFGKGSSNRFGLSPDGGTLVAVGGGDATTPATVFLINPTNNTVIQSTPLPTNTTNLTVAVTPTIGTSTFAYITTDATLQLLDISVADPNYGTFAQGVTATVPVVPTSSAITSDGVTLGFVASTPNINPNIASLNTASLFSSPSFVTGYAGQYPGIITDSQADFLPSANAPQISSISPLAIVNNTSNQIVIDGSNFSSDALVKVGSDNPIVPSSVSPTELTVTLPPFTPSGYLHLIVINKNAQDPSIANHNIPSAPYPLYVLDGPGFSQNYDSFTLNVGSSSVLSNGSYQSILRGSFSKPVNIASPTAIVASTNDNWFIASSAQPAGSVTQGSSDPTQGFGTRNITLVGNSATREGLALVKDPTTGRDVVLLPSTYPPSQGSYDWQLNVVDGDPYSPTYDTVLRWIPAGTSDTAPNSSEAFAATPDGKFAYQQVNLNNGTSDLVIYDLTNNAATVKTGLGIDANVHGMQVSPDGKYLVVANPTAYNIQVFSISSPTAPNLVGTIVPTKPAGSTLTNCCNLRIANNFLYVYDPGTMQVQAFSFQPPNFGTAGVLQLKGSPDYFLQGGLAVTPDGSNLYVAELNNDVIDVIDTKQFGSGDINLALLTRISSQGIGPASIALNGTPSAQSFADLSITSSHSPDPETLGGLFVYSVTATNLGPDTSGEVIVTDTLPPGFTFTGFDFTGGNVTCNGTTVVTCDLGTGLSANQQITVYVEVSTTGVSSQGQYTNTVSVGQTGQTVPDPNTANNTATDITNLASPDLAITGSADNLSPASGGTVNFTLNVANKGQVLATGVTISGSLTAGTLTKAPGCTTTATTFSCAVTDVNPGASINGVTITATMPGTAGSVVFNASVTENESDGNPADNTLTPPITISVGGGADIVLAPAGAPVNINNVPTYTVLVTNNGPDPAQDVTLKDALSGFGFVSAGSTVGSCSFNGTTVICPLGNMAVGTSVTVNVSVIPPSGGWASNEFKATSDTFDPVPTNNLVNMGPFGGNIGNTAAGLNVLVDALDSNSGLSANFLFSSITKPGLTKVSSVAGTQPPAGYRFGSPALIYDLSTSASYSGLIRVAMRFSGVSFHHPNALRLFHFENGVWVDRTATLDAAHGMITGMTSSLSPFAIVEPLNSVPLANAGADQVLAGTGTNGASVTLTGAASTDVDGDSLSYTWTGPFPEGNGSVIGVNPKVTLPLGTSKVVLVVNDGEATSTPAAVKVTVSDFLIATPTTAITLARGQSASFNVVLTPKYGAFNDPVTVACGNVPAGLTCAVKDNSVTPGTQGTSVTVTLTASASAGLRNNSGPLFAFWLGGVPVFGILFTGKFKRDRRTMFIVLAIILLMIAGMVACGGAGANSASQPPPPSSTSTTVTLTGTSGDLQHSSTATVIIQ